MHPTSARALDLARLQREFQDYVLHRDPAVLEHVLGTGAADAATRMDVYADGYPLRLLEALETDYPGLKAIAGEQDFEALGRAFIAACPSTFRNLRWYGERLAQFLETSPAWSDRIELADMARFEWAMAMSFDALDAACLSREALTGVSADNWPRLSFIMHPAVQRVDLKTDVTRAWSAQTRGEELPPLRREAAATTWLLTRRRLQVRFRAMTPEEAIALDRLAARASFAQWCAELGEVTGEDRAAQTAVEFLNQWLADGALAGFALEPDLPSPAQRERGGGEGQGQGV
jgi:putative DNA-binding protein